MKILPIFLRNNIPNEFYITNSDSKKIVLEQLVCKAPITFDITKCIVFVNDMPFNFVKGGWASPDVFHINGIPNKMASHNIEPLSLVKFMLKIDCKKGDEEKYENIHFHLHLSVESDFVNETVWENEFNLGLAF